jgi:hypothetical protein
MAALIIGLVFIAFGVVACLPGALNWGPDVLTFLRGASPVVALLVGLIALFIGFADIKDRAEAKKEEAEEAKKEEKKA